MNRPTFDEEEVLWNKGYEYVIGVDEVGRGAFAGPLVAAAVVFDRNKKCTREILDHINDSKLLKASLRESLSELIQRECLHFAISVVNVSVINKLGVGKANFTAIRTAVRSIRYKVYGIQYSQEKENTKYSIPHTAYFTLIDGFKVSHMPGGSKHSKGLIHGDRRSISVAAASIIAKVYRDDLMTKLHGKFDQYGFDKHKGYGTKFHQEAIKEFGLSKIHRTSFDLSQFLMSSST